MNRFARENGLNPHVWEKFKRAERNFVRCWHKYRGRFRSRHWRKTRKWGRQMRKWVERVVQ